MPAERHMPPPSSFLDIVPSRLSPKGATRATSFIEKETPLAPPRNGLRGHVDEILNEMRNFDSIKAYLLLAAKQASPVLLVDMGRHRKMARLPTLFPNPRSPASA
jgi:hypothetical protein